MKHVEQEEFSVLKRDVHSLNYKIHSLRGSSHLATSKLKSLELWLAIEMV